MENRNCEILFEYLRSILYDSKVEALDISQLDEPFQKLGMGLIYLAQAVQEMKAYSADLSIGNLSGTYPGRENFLCENLKNLHANLNHLTWQAKQVAAGDYSQHVSYLGEFSEAFNTMTEQLREREELLKKEAEREKGKAYTDLLTRVGNRFYFKEEMEKILRQKETFVFCYFDLDHLKYINDKYGHMEGDEYLRKFAEIVRERIRENDMFARIGGDEFCAVFLRCPKESAEKKLGYILEEFRKQAGIKYPAGFSYGMIEVDPQESQTIDEILKRADRAMYEQKRIHKEQYEQELMV